MGKKAAIIGATGLIGSHLLQLLEQDKSVDEVVVLARRTFKASSPKTVIHEVDFNNPKSYGSLLKGCTHAFCCLGTTMKKAGSKEAFYQVDHEYVLSFARQTHLQNCTSFSLVSSLGADASSVFYYNRVKGKIEKAIQEIPFKTIHIFRPSLLLGNRNEKRQGENFAKWADKTFSWLIPNKYKGIEGAKVAKAMLEKANNPVQETAIYESEEIRKM
ncbi:NAD(P)H-binding protein [Flammeovirgaceae bacterium SG7u.111]|nr:NAD(P)H-binding protein [Flammeovirgaceae bacterium SG7u.132]WPO34742.1 NAD(P)H-binding protein [Flammeovirgaceae bacterium SG7u.111]